jgi:hypothetical protein
MTVDFEIIAAALADDATISDDELVRLLGDLHAAARRTNVVDLEKYKIRKVLEACARLRDMEWNGSTSTLAHR